MMCMVKKACLKEEGVLGVPALTSTSCQPMISLNSFLGMTLTFLDQLDSMIRSSVSSVNHIKCII